jgi:hypothetical protein
MFRDRITPIIYRMDGQRGRVAEAEASSFLWFSRAPAIQRQYNNDVDRAVEDVIGSMERDPRVFNAILVRDPNTPNLRPGPQTIEYVGNTLRSMYGQMRREAYNISETMNGRAGDLRRSRNPRAFDHITNNRDGTLRRGTSNITGSDQGRYEGAPVGFDD